METNDQHAIYEAARTRTKQKKRLYFHFILFLVGSVFAVILNKAMNVLPNEDWYIWVIMIWLFFLVIHFLNVFVFNPVFGQEWERSETEKLIAKHNKKVEKLESKLQKEGVFDRSQEPDPEL